MAATSESILFFRPIGDSVDGLISIDVNVRFHFGLPIDGRVISGLELLVVGGILIQYYINDDVKAEIISCIFYVTLL